jgi:hypothetical protein
VFDADAPASSVDVANRGKPEDPSVLEDGVADDNATTHERAADIPGLQSRTQTITWAVDAKDSSTLRIPSPRDRDNGAPVQVVEGPTSDDDDDDDDKIHPISRSTSNDFRRRGRRLSTSETVSLDRIASSMFVLGSDGKEASRSKPRDRSTSRPPASLPQLSSQATEGRHSSFHNLTTADREALGGLEYRSLRLLLKIVVGECLRHSS